MKKKPFMLAVDGCGYGNMDWEAITNIKEYFVNPFNNKKKGIFKVEPSLYTSDLEQRIISTYTPDEILDMIKNPNKSKRVIELLLAWYIPNVVYKIDKNRLVNAYDEVDLVSKRLTRIPVKFGQTTGSFLIQNNELTTFEGCPSWIGYSFDCCENRLTSLEHFPKFVKGNIYCFNNLVKFTAKQIRAVCECRGSIYNDYQDWDNGISAKD